MADFQCVLCLSSGLCIIHRVKERETERKIEEEGRQKDKRQQAVCLELSSFFALSVSQSLCLSVDLTALRSGSEVKLLLGQTWLNLQIPQGGTDSTFLLVPNCCLHVHCKQGLLALSWLTVSAVSLQKSSMLTIYTCRKWTLHAMFNQTATLEWHCLLNFTEIFNMFI